MLGTTDAVIAPHREAARWTPAQLRHAQLKIAWDMLSQVAEHLDQLPLPARVHVADALSELAQAKALVEETGA
jgi:hypothetical protein